MAKQITTQQLDTVAIRFAGDSGDGMQLTGSQFTETATLVGNDIATFPDFSCRNSCASRDIGRGIRTYRSIFLNYDIHTHGDEPDVLIAMNPAALKANIGDLKPSGIVVANTSAFKSRELDKAGYDSNPLEDGSLDSYRVFEVDITTLTLNAIADCGLNQRSAVRCKNFFALGLVYWMFNRSIDHSMKWIEQKFGAKDRPCRCKSNGAEGRLLLR